MRITDVDSHQADDAPRVTWRRRVGWLVLIWAASVAALGLVAGALKIAMTWAGLGVP